jgi:hypothetical protein
MKLNRLWRMAPTLALLGSSLAWAQTGDNAEVRARVEKAAAGLAGELAAKCPAAAPDSKPAYDSCRQALFAEGSVLRSSLPKYVLWGRQRDPNVSLKNTNLTQFGPDVFSNMYLPLFMFNGKHTVKYVESEGLYQVRLQTAFRNRLEPGQFPYPFWHEADKWGMYEQAREILLWWDGKKNQIKVAQFTVHAETPPIVATESVKHPPHDGKWLWTDAQGRTQPMVTVFDGVFKAENPYISKLDSSYKALALRLRESQCDECHVPNNPDKMKRLVLLQTPAHAGAEIARVIKSVRDDKMPIDKIGVEQPLDAAAKAALLKDAEAFEKMFLAAKEWEKNARR